MSDSPIRVSASFSYKFQPRKYESAEIVMHLSQIPADASEDEIEDAKHQGATALMKMMDTAFTHAKTAIDMAQGLPKE
jgi:hypothetical protein